MVGYLIVISDTRKVELQITDSSVDGMRLLIFIYIALFCLPDNAINHIKLVSVRYDNESIYVSGYVSRPNLFEHFRAFRIKPFDEILIKATFTKTLDSLPFYKEYSFAHGTPVTSNLHMHPSVSVRMTGQNRVQLDELATVDMTSEECWLEIIAARMKPMLGWVSFKCNSIESTSVIHASCAHHQAGGLEWRITLH